MKINKIPGYVVILSYIMFSLVLGISWGHNTYAQGDTGWNTVIQKTTLMGLKRCYDVIKTDISGDDFVTFNKFGRDAFSGGGSEEYVALPNGLTNINDSNVSCEQLFDGYNIGGGNNTFKGILKLSGKSSEFLTPPQNKATQDPEQKLKLLTKMGYENTGSSDNKNCVYFRYSASGSEGSNELYTNNVCAQNGTLFIDKLARVSASWYSSIGEYTNGVIYFYGSLLSVNNNTLTINGGNAGTAPTTDVKYTGNWQSFSDSLVSTMNSKYSRFDSNGSYSINTVGTNGVAILNNKQDNNGYGLTMNDKGNAVRQAIGYLSTYSNGVRDLEFTNAEKLSYYINTIKEWFFSGVSTSDYWICDVSSWPSAGITQIYLDSGMSRNMDSCGIRVGESVKTQENKNQENSKYIYGFNGNFFDASGGTTLTLEEVIEKINELIPLLSDEELLDAGVSLAIHDNADVNCLTSGAAENLGWIICPILSFASEVSQDMYTNFVEPALKVEPKLFQERDGEDNDAYDAWLVFQGFANILFVIFFLFVIFSQLTGVGIDNYGIKKIMPKLIVTAILINLSYLICLICIDLSNIIGNGITGLFSGLSENLGMSADIASGDGGSVVVSIGSTMLTGVALFGAGYLAYVTAAMWILPLLVAAIGLLVSVIFLFILLAGREAALVVLTIISPLAFACYMLPNTKNLFSKYIKVGEVLLLLYPICGLMVAGGGYVSKLLLSVGAAEEGFFSAFAAMMISIIPIFFIPKVVKNSFNALGRLGASISGFGDRMRGRATSGIRGSGAYKAGQERLREGQTRWRAGVGENMNFRQRLARGVFTRRGVARNRAQFLKDQDARRTEDRYLRGDYMAAATAAAEAKAESEAIDQRLALIKTSGINGKAYTVDNASDRIRELSDIAARRELTGDQKLELAALARGLSNEKGGGGKLASAIRDANKNGINSNFMSAMGEIYSKDSTVKSKLNEKDSAASVFTEQFLPNSQNRPTRGTFQDFRNGNMDRINGRIKTYAQGLSQSGSWSNKDSALYEYASQLEQADIDRIYADKSMVSGLETDALHAIDQRAAELRAQQQQPRWGDGTGSSGGS